MLARRTLLATAGAAVLAQRARAALPIPNGDSLTFLIMRFDREIGRHTLTFDCTGDALTVRIAMDVAVTFAGLTLARYRHRGVETWQGNTLVGLAGETDNNGDRGWMDARRTAEGLVVTGSKTTRYVAPDQTGPASYWDKRMLDRPMISLEDGVLLSRKVADPRTDSVRLASGRIIEASRYNLSGKPGLDLWYDHTATWAGMAMTVVDGSEVRYERL
jgi:hypothetical protein